VLHINFHVDEIKKASKPMGRPELRQTSFHPPVELVAKIDEEDEAIAFGNKSGLVKKILEEYFAKK
jgi:hypothetical protein